MPGHLPKPALLLNSLRKLNIWHRAVTLAQNNSLGASMKKKIAFLSIFKKYFPHAKCLFSEVVRFLNAGKTFGELKLADRGKAEAM